MRNLYNHIKNIFTKLGQVISLVFVWLYELITWLIDNTIGFIFTKEYRKLNKNYNNDYQLWQLVRKIVLITILLVFIFSFDFIYQHTLFHVFKSIFIFFGNNLDGIYGRMLREFGPQFSSGIGVTLYLSLIGTSIGFIFAVILSSVVTLKINREDSKLKAFFKKAGIKLTKLYVSIVRGTPMMVQAMILYYGVRSFISWDFFVAALVTVSINTTAYLTEVLRGGIESIDKGQTEGALSLGLTRTQTMLNVIYPQAIKNSMAAIGNEFVINIKDTAVLSVIMIEDIFRIAELAQARYLSAFPAFIIAAFIYLFLTTTITAILRRVEKRLNLPSQTLPSSN